ncbi:lysophospholipid acyltransferase family protein [Mycolicibacterium vaccae]|uniref:lysophospholipid acyltransferase family protein n=1 Tax=Mycolicibacterium vaccae TaxID=1810 RepID=UPI003D04DC81
MTGSGWSATVAEMPVEAWRWVLRTSADNLGPIVNLYKPYVDGLEHLRPDGRFLIVGNHTMFSAAEILLIPYFVRHHIGKRVRPLADRQFGKMPKPQRDVMTAFGGVVGSPDTASALMDEGETILVFPGGGREIPKFQGEEYTLRWQNRSGFARIAIKHQYPIVTAALVGGDDVVTSVGTRDSALGRLSTALGRLGGREDMAMPILRGLGPTPLPRPQRMYLRFGPAIETARPKRVTPLDWTAVVKDRVQDQLENDLADLLALRESDPYRHLNPLRWRSAVLPESPVRHEGA